MLTLADLKRLEEQAHIGPWTFEQWDRMHESTDPEPDYGGAILAGDGESIVCQRTIRPDAEFIIAAVAYVRGLLSASACA